MAKISRDNKELVPPTVNDGPHPAATCGTYRMMANGISDEDSTGNIWSLHRRNMANKPWKAAALAKLNRRILKEKKRDREATCIKQ